MVPFLETISLTKWDSLNFQKKIFAILFFVVCLSIYFGVVHGFTRFNHDMAEAYAWGKEFQFGYPQHPPYFSWLAGAWFLIFPHELWAFGILSSVNAVAGLVGSIFLMKEFSSEAPNIREKIALALLIVMPNYSILAFKWDANIPFIALCPWTLFFFIRSIRYLKGRDSILFGVFTGLSLLNKYFAVVYLVCCFIVAVSHKNRQRYFLSTQPYISVGVSFLVLLPHLIWLLQFGGREGATPLHYFGSKIGWDFKDILFNIFGTVGTIFFIYILPLALFIMGSFFYTTRSLSEGDRGMICLSPEFSSHDFRILALGPIFLALLASFIFRTPLTAEMFIGIMPLIPLSIVSIFSDEFLKKVETPLFRLSVVYPLLLVIFAPLVFSINVLTKKNIVPTKEIALKAAEIWKLQTGKPLGLVGGDNWLENATVFYAKDEAHSFIRMSKKHSLWVSDGDVEKRGLLVICQFADEACRTRGMSFMTPQSSLQNISLRNKVWGQFAREYKFTIIVIPPQ